ncbi:hypothetical protein CVT25_001760 [Psilocybe cyanescens]|uniref:Uncharacterized protein n=1 Tax=Psilocybe cyanescens TaxID=93625 RepID=A0A409WPT2_PSICY|nr:hypothetical protein CVT25_001760 [Psilocybe cyanescens]
MSDAKYERDFTLELQIRNPDKSVFLKIIDDIPAEHLRPLANSALMKYDRVRRIWIAYFTWLHNEQTANKTLQAKAPLPPIQEVKALIKEAAVNGTSGFKGKGGWSYSTARDFVSTISHMRARHFTIAMTKDEIC